MNLPKEIKLNGVTYTPSTIAHFASTATDDKSEAMYHEVIDFLNQWYDDNDVVMVRTSGSTGVPKLLAVKKIHMYNSARLTCSFFSIEEHSNALLCMPAHYIAGKMMLVRAMVSRCNLWVIAPCGNPFKSFSKPLDFLPIVPLQLFNTLQHEEEVERLLKVSKIMIGGGAIDSEIEKQLNGLTNEFYSSYGMTETVSHIAIRRLNGKGKSEWYTPLPQVEVSKTIDGGLCVHAPLVCDKKLMTNDIIELMSDGRFRIIGRMDNIINSGGVKLQIELIETKLKSFIKLPFAITYRSDARLGSAVTLLIANSDSTKVPTLEQLKQQLPPYEVPQSIYLVDKIPTTETGKTKRQDCQELAEACYLKEIENGATI